MLYDLTYPDAPLLFGEPLTDYPAQWVAQVAFSADGTLLAAGGDWRIGGGPPVFIYSLTG